MDSNGEVNVKTLKIDSVSVNVGADKLNHLGTVQSDVQVQTDVKLNSTTASNTYSVKEGSNSIVTVGNLNSGSISSGFGSINVGSETNNNG